MGLNNLHKAIREEILMMTPFVSIDTVYSLLIHEEKKHEISTNPRKTSSVLNARNRSMLTLNVID